MKALRWLCLVPVDLIVTALSILLSPIMAQAIYFGENNRLPAWLWLWQTPDDDALGSNESAMDWTRRYPRWFQCMVWLCRNSCYGFAWYVLGAKVPADRSVQVFGDRYTNNLPFNTGLRLLLCAGYWELFIVFPTWPGRCFRARLGWKLDRWLAGNYSMPAQFVCSVNPWKARD